MKYQIFTCNQTDIRPICGCAKNCPGFNGKEKDYESGFHYYGARYYESEVLAGWLSVDPMMDKYPGLSPYNYCTWNPVKLVDPDGRDWYDLLEDGTLVKNEERSIYYQNKDVVYSKQSRKLSKEYVLGTIGDIKEDKLSYALQDGEKTLTRTATGQRFTIFGDANTAQDIFKFCASNSQYVEYSLIESEDNISYLVTSHKRTGDDYGTAFGLNLARKGKLLSHTHNHPGKSSEFSAGDKFFYNGATKLMQCATQSDFVPTFRLFIFIDKAEGGKYYDYKAD